MQDLINFLENAVGLKNKETKARRFMPRGALLVVPKPAWESSIGERDVGSPKTPILAGAIVWPEKGRKYNCENSPQLGYQRQNPTHNGLFLSVGFWELASIVVSSLLRLNHQKTRRVTTTSL